MALRAALTVSPARTKGKMPPINSPVKIRGSVKEMRPSVSGVSKWTLLRNPPNRVIPTRAVHPIFTERFTVSAFYPYSANDFRESLSSWFRSAISAAVCAFAESA